MGGDHHHQFKVPDWRSYKVEDVPELCQTKEALAQKGLKDPWLRNEVWRYQDKIHGTEGRLKTFLLRGFRVGFAAFVVTTIAEQLWALSHPNIGHGHDH